MIKILIVDDDSSKIKDICEIINEFSEIPQNNIDYELEIKKAYQKLQQVQYDLVILDIKLPNKMGTTTLENGGIELLQLISNTERIKKPSQIIGLTSYDSSYDEYEKSFNENAWFLLKYSSSCNEWKDQIRKKISYLIKWKINMINQIKYSEDYDYDFAIITAVEREYKSVLDLDIEWKIKDVPNDATQYKEGIINGKNGEFKIVLAKQSQMGMTAASTLSMKMIHNFKPAYLCMLGIAAGKKGEVNLGDIIVAAESWDYGSGKIKNNNLEEEYFFQPEPHQIAINTELKELLSNDYTKMLYDIRMEWNRRGAKEALNDIKVHVGALASGAAVIQNDDIVSKFIDPHNRKLLGLDMETYGVYYAANNSPVKHPQFLSIKAVCDFADKNKSDDYQGYASYASASFFYNIVKENFKK